MKNEELDVQAIIIGMRVSLIHHEDLPLEIQEAVAVELRRQREQKDNM